MSKGTGAAAGPDGRLEGDLLVLRRIHRRSGVAPEERASASAFDMSAGGRISVHVDGLASAAGLRIRHGGLHGLFAALVGDLRENGFGVELRPENGDPSHAEIFVLPGSGPEEMDEDGWEEKSRSLAGLFSRRPGMIFKR